MHFVGGNVTTLSFVHAEPKGKDERGREKVYLHPGHVYVGLKPTMISCMLGSCVAVCLWERTFAIGGAVHYLLPGDAGISSQKSGTQGIRDLLSRMRDAGARPANIIGRVFGGACVLEELRSNHIGTRNIETASAYLRSECIPILEEHVGGTRGRKLVFLTDTGEAQVKLV